MSAVSFKFVEVDYQKPYSEQTDCKRHVVGAYANLARHHMTLAVNTVMRAIDMKPFGENDIKNAFNSTHREEIKKLDNSKKVILQERLYRHFPMLKRMKLEDKEKKSVQLNTLLQVMSDFTYCMALLRNEYTHYKPYNAPEEKDRQNKHKKAIGIKLSGLFENSKKVFSSNEKIDASVQEVFSSIRRIEKDNEGNKVYRFNPDFQLSMIDHQGSLSDVGVIYFLCLFLDKQQGFNLMEEVSFIEYLKNSFKEEEVAFIMEILCMNRVRMTQLKLDSEISDTALALDMMNELCKCPQPLYEVLGKDARDEFKDDMTKAWEQENGEEAAPTQGLEEEKPRQENKNVPRSTFVRWEDRFPEMALKYIDLTGMFNSIRFRLHLGKYRFEFYNHDKAYNVDDEENKLRVLQKEIHGFGRIHEVKDVVKEKWHAVFEQKQEDENGQEYKLPDEAGQSPYVTREEPYYAIDEKSHSIGMRWEGWDKGHYNDLKEKKMFVPYLSNKPAEVKDTTDEKQQKHPCPAECPLPPQCQMSLYELPALLFYQYLMKDKDKHAAEQVIIDCYENLSNFFNDLKNGELKPSSKVEFLETLKNKYHLKGTDIPERLYKYLIGDLPSQEERNKRFGDIAKERLREKKEKVLHLQNEFTKKKEKIGTKDNKFGENRKTIKTGALAQWLAHDIMEWMPISWKNKHQLSSQNFMAIQSALVMLGQWIDSEEVMMTYDKLQKIFEKAEIIIPKDKLSSHPFLLKVFTNKPESVEVFYEKYLEMEFSHIEDIELKLYKAKNVAESVQSNIPFLQYHRERRKKVDKDSMMKLVNRYMEQPLQLPDGLFTEHILNLLKENDALKDELGKESDTNHLYTNVAYLIKLYFEIVEEDGSQSFYDTSTKNGEYCHIYRVLKKLYEKESFAIDEIRNYRKEADEKVKNMDEGEEKKQALKRQLRKVYDNERTIRRYKTQDVLLFIMAREILKSKGNSDNNVFDSEVFKMKNMLDENKKLLDAEVDFEWKVSLDNGKMKTIEQKGMRIKNFGAFYKFATDQKRLVSLLSQLTDTDRFQRSEIENEFAYYDVNRSEVFEQVYIIESLAYKLSKERKNEDLTNDDNANEPWFKYKSGKDDLQPKRNNFFQLLELFVNSKDVILDKEEEALLRQIRNAFSHNTYDVKFDDVFECKEGEGKRKVPEVSNGIKNKMVCVTEKIKRSLS